MKYYCINMKHAAERRTHCQQQFERAGLDVTFVSGFDGRASQLTHNIDWVSKGVGCFISHYTVLEEIRHNRYGVTVIFEDDVILPDGFAETMGTVLEQLPAGWQVAALNYENDNAEVVSVNDTWQQSLSGQIWRTGAYVVNGYEAAENILNHILPINLPIDRALWEAARDKRVAGYFIKQPICAHADHFATQIY